jgi:hypothetical protein
VLLLVRSQMLKLFVRRCEEESWMHRCGAMHATPHSSCGWLRSFTGQASAALCTTATVDSAALACALVHPSGALKMAPACSTQAAGRLAPEAAVADNDESDSCSWQFTASVQWECWV